MKILKYTLILFIVFKWFSSEAQSKYQLGCYGLYYMDDVKPTVSVFYTNELSKKFTLINYFYTDKNWGQGIFGVKYRFTDWFQAGCMAGLQTNNKEMFRYAPVFWLKKNKSSLFGIFEKGGQRDRFKLLYYYKFGKQLKAGLYGIKFIDIYAFGPRSEIKLGKTPFSIWGTPLYIPTNGEYAAMLGLYFKHSTKKE